MYNAGLRLLLYIKRLFLWVNIKTKDIRQFIAHLKAKQEVCENHKYRSVQPPPLLPTTIHGIVSTVSAFFDWAIEEGMLTSNPMERISAPKVSKTIKERFSQGDVERILQACEEFPQSLAVRNRAMVLFLHDTGVRAAELCSLVLDQVVHDGKHHTQAVSACAIHLLDRIWTILKEDRAYELCDVDETPVTAEPARQIIAES